MNEVSVPKSKCPNCGYEMDAATNVTGKSGPSANDFTLCIMCAEVLRFNEDMTLRSTTPSELTELAPRARFILSRAQEAIRECHATRSN